MPHYTQAKLDETIALLVNQGFEIETMRYQDCQLVIISSGTLPKLKMYLNEETGALRVAGNSWPSELYARIHAALSDLTFEIQAFRMTDGPPGRTSFWFFSDNDTQRDELIRWVKAVFAIAGVIVPLLDAFAA
jgi:hypothetical protein